MDLSIGQEFAVGGEGIYEWESSCVDHFVALSLPRFYMPSESESE
jgi:hypothetical protein